MPNYRLIMWLAALLTIGSCGSREAKLRTAIAEAEKQLFESPDPGADTAKSGSMVKMYLSYVEAYPADTNSSNYLFRAADLSAKTNDVHSAIQLYEKLVQEYPDSRHTPLSIFLQGFIYENQAKDPLKARPYYEKFLANYPDHALAADVAFSLENLGKTPEELIRQFESKQTVSGDSSLTAN